MAMAQPDSLHNNSATLTAQATGFSRLLVPQRYPNNLLLQLTSFIGREQEIAKVRQLSWSTRFLTLIGRVVVAAAHREVHDLVADESIEVCKGA
jgi:hypothetical protein